MTHGRILERLLVVGMFCICFTSVLMAEELKGSFSLPEDTYWGGVLLQAGQYRFTVDSNGQEPMNIRSSEGKVIIRLVAYTEAVETPAKSQLVIVHSTIEKPTVHILFMADVKTAYHFNVPQRYEVTSRIIATTSSPADIEHIPVVTGN